ncbi:PREDICTED: uncharacterized protein LOC106147021 isoform X3 [Chinchilla lanigera]|uniref:uncharacterized protein LOC106147021 isoform X3 n=1 Tax=Chinchilla lanigera TaxID=34839 RepID=UPI000697E920|nr:PREDICTED: uncharacterized protein LOC106147021 isoform X3 [Chinchilla lanigera]
MDCVATHCQSSKRSQAGQSNIISNITMDNQDIDPSHPFDSRPAQNTMIKHLCILGVFQMMDGMVLTVLWAVVIANSSRYKLSIIQIHPILPYLYLLVPLIYVTAGILNIVAANRQNPKLITAFRVFKFVTFQASLIFSIMHGVDTFEVAGRRGVFPVDVLSLIFLLSCLAPSIARIKTMCWQMIYLW